MRRKHENMHCEHHTIKNNRTHITNSTKYTQTIFEHLIFQNSTKKPKIQEIKARNMKYFEKI